VQISKPHLRSLQISSRRHWDMLTEQAARERTSSGWSGDVFGLSVEADFDMPCLPPTRRAGTLGNCVVRSGSLAELEEQWNCPDAARLFDISDEAGQPLLTLDFHENAGARVWGHEHGTFVINADGTRIQCAPAAGPAWLWRRFLIGQVLPMAALLHGLEILHASAVSIGGHGLVFAGPSLTGKSSVAAHLLLSDADLLADDVVSTEVSGDGVRAHPGMGLLGLRHEERVLLTPGQLDALGTCIAENEKEQLFAVRSASGPQQVTGVYLLGRRAHGSEVRFEPVDDSRFLLASTFNNVFRTTERLQRMLDVYAALSRTAAVLRVIAPTTAPAATVADAIRRHHAASRGSS